VAYTGIVTGSRTVTTTRDERAPRHPDLVKRGWAAPNRPDAVWVADFTYVWTACGFCYVSFITDVYSRRILGWRASMSKTTDLVTAALAQALATRLQGGAGDGRPGLGTVPALDRDPEDLNAWAQPARPG